MSRLTASPFHKPSPFEFPRAPLSPPETHSDTIAPGVPPVTSAGHSISGQEYFPNETPLTSASPDTSSSRFRKSSSIPYHSSGLRENRERTPQRSSKSLIIVIPPPTLIEEHGQHGQTLSNGPYHRLSQGVVMPLFPSMFGQLTAIAREFNFPSTTGLCLYFHHVEDGITLTPRISDESWQPLWSHLSEPLPTSERRLISGKVEFDIDIRLARWYAAWVSAIHRETSDHFSLHHSSAAPSIAHYRGESRTTTADTRFPEEEAVENSVIPQHSARISRHVPRKLSLVERFDMSSARQDSRTASQTSATHPAHPDALPSGSQVLTTIVQEDEPKTARQDLASRVKTWRASALITPTKLAASGQTSLDPSNLPNNVPLDISASPDEEDVEQELRLEDFTWSVSSVGPLSSGEISPLSWSLAPSIDLARRMEGSVASTASYRTSFGPSDYDPLSPVAWGQWSPVPSIDLGRRMEGSVCSTPSTRTSFGPSDYDPLSPAGSSRRLATPDIAHRFFESTPPTPHTATTWGAPLSYPPSPRCASPALSVDIGERSMHDALDAPQHQYTGRTVAEPWSLVWPYNDRSLNASHSEHLAVVEPWSHVWPYSGKSIHTTHLGPDRQLEETATMTPWTHVWPYNRSVSSGATVVKNRNVLEVEWRSHSTFGYPHLTIYAPVYPYFDLYPGKPVDLHESSSGCDRMDSIATKIPAAYPNFDLYPAVYPYNLAIIYPSSVEFLQKADLSSCYPYLNIYPSTSAPYNAYLSLHLSNPHSQYPEFEIYPPVVKHEKLGGSKSQPTVRNTEVLSTRWQGYPMFHLYVAVYPHFDLYPATRLQSEIAAAGDAEPPKNFFGSGYPMFNLYPAVYPFFDLYPALDIRQKTVATSLVHHAPSPRVTPRSGYPTFNLYPAVYPHFDLYPVPYFGELGQQEKVDAERGSRLINVSISPGYPSFNLYPTLYPYLNIYPAPYFSDVSRPGGTTFSSCEYPHFDLYPAVKERRTSPKVVPTSLPEYRYPVFNLYPAVYPHFDLYPAFLQAAMMPHSQPKRKAKSSRLTHSELHAMVMMERVSSAGTFDAIESRTRMLGAGRHNHSPGNSINDSVSIPSSGSLGNLRRPSLAFKAGSYLQSIDQSSTSLNHNPPTSSSRQSSDQGYRSSLIRKPSNGSSLPGIADQGHGSTLIRKSSTQRGVKLPSRRDSLVLQRVKAFDANADTLPPLMKEVSKFPMPPKTFPPLPSIPGL